MVFIDAFCRSDNPGFNSTGINKTLFIMKICLSKYIWYNNDNVWVTGFIRKGDRYLEGNELLNYFSGIDTVLQFENVLGNANGQFSVIIKSAEVIWAATDRLRNFPLFFSRIDDLYTISDDSYVLAGSLPLTRFNTRTFDCFLSTGYVLNNETLAENVFQIEAGEYVVIGNTFSRKFYFDLNNVPIKEKEFNTAVNELNTIISDLFRDHFKALDNEFIAIALSGGFDSRLIAAMCSKYHPQNVICYTYGSRNNPEVPLAKEVAKRLGIKWINIEYNSDLIEGFLDDDVFKKYFPYASGLSGMFFMQEYFAVKYLKEKRLVPDNCVFITGFSGDMLAGSHLLPEMKRHMDNDSIARLIYKEFCGMVKLTHPKKSDIINMIREKIPGVRSETWLVFENWDQKERQAKFIVNSAKVFTFFGYRYILPLWDNMLADFFYALPFRFKLNKKLYDYVLKEYIFNELDLNLSEELNPLPAQKIIQRIKERIKLFLPHKITDLFIQHQSPVFYDEITKIMIRDLGNNIYVYPVQSNYYNSYIIQWYLFKTQEHLMKNNGEK